jgi:hypothetical protein
MISTERSIISHAPRTNACTTPQTLEQKANALNEENMLLKKKVKDLQTLLDSKK